MACRAAVPAVVVLGAIAMLIQPEVFAETEDTGGATPWGGAIAGLALFLLFTAVPPALFGHALRAGTRRGLVVTLLAAALLALYVGVLPLIQALVAGWDGLSVIAVLTAAAVAVLEGFVVAAAVTGIGRIDRGPAAPT